MWLLLSASLLSLRFKPVLAAILGVIFLALASFNGIITLPALAILLVLLLGIAIKIVYRQQQNLALYLLEALLVLAAIALMLHLLPGFNNPRIVSAEKVGPLSAPFSFYFNADKALLPFILLACLPTLFIRPARQVPLWAWALLALSVPMLLLIATAAGGLKIELHWPTWLPQFILANIFFVSLAEEALFRGYLQQRLQQWIGAIPALLVCALLFGLTHSAGGLLLVIFASLAGLLYGLAWLWSGRLWVAVLFHFALNLIHLLFFTYPAYQPL